MPIQKKKLILNLLRVAVFLLIVWFIAGRIRLDDSYTDAQGKVHYGEIAWNPSDDHILFDGRPVALHEIRYDPSTDPYTQGLRKVVANMKPGLLALALAVWIVVPLITVWRWQILLQIQGVTLRFADAFKLTFIGMFFNNAIPGLTGGDIVKAFYLAKRIHRKTEAITTIVLDRVIGMMGLIAICAIMLTFKLGDENFRDIAAGVLVAIGVVVLGLIVFFVEAVRHALGIDKIKSLLPFQKVVHDIDRAILVYKKHVPAVSLLLAMSVCVHVGIAMLNFVLGSAIGITQMDFSDYLVITPILLTIMALPVAPAGWGVGEMAFTQLLPKICGVAWSMALALSIAGKLVQLVWSLLGGIFLVTGGHKVSPKELIHEIEAAEHEIVEASKPS